jgi:serine/threonine-protein kinase
MAPEQADAAAIRPATDVWALGLIAFDALVGQPYWRSAADGSTLTRLLVEILTEPLEPASARATALAGPDVAARLPAEFDAFFARAVARDSYDRFDNANDALDALDDVLRGVPMRRFTREVMSAEDALAKTAVSVPPPASHGAGTSPGAAASPASAVSSAPGPFRGTAETQPAPSPLAATHPGGAARSWSGVVAGVVAGVGLAALAGAAWMVRDAGEAPAAQVAAAPLTRPTEEQRAPEGGGRDTGEASAPSRAPTPTTAPGARLDVADPVGHAGASDALAAAAPSGPAPSRVGASAGPGASPHRSGGTPPAARARPQGAEAQRFRSTIIVPCWRDNAPADAAPVSLSVVLGFGGTGNIATVRVDGTHDANVRRCIVMRGTTYRMLEPPTSPTLTVRARLP